MLSSIRLEGGKEDDDDGNNIWLAACDINNLAPSGRPNAPELSILILKLALSVSVCLNLVRLNCLFACFCSIRTQPAGSNKSNNQPVADANYDADDDEYDKLGDDEHSANATVSCSVLVPVDWIYKKSGHTRRHLLLLLILRVATHTPATR